MNELGPDTSRSLETQVAAAPTVVAPTSLPPTAVPTAAPSPTSTLTEPPAQPVVTYQNYTVHAGDTLEQIAIQNGTTTGYLMQLNGIKNPNVLDVGQVLKVKSVVQAGRAPSDRLVPDSEAVYSPSYEGFDVNAVAQKFGGYLTRYQENVEGSNLTGPQIVQLVSSRFSVGPRVLLSILELEGGWVTGNPPTLTQLYYPMGLANASWSGLYRQLWYAADKLNEGYYGRVYKTIDGVGFGYGVQLKFSANVNPGTAALEHYLSLVSPFATWKNEVGPDGFSAAYQKLFGDPFAHAIEPLVPDNLIQPALHLPWEQGHTWWFTGGPHGGWADGSAWAAVDFAPTQGSGACVPSSEWATAAAPGQIVTVETGRVMENLDGKNFQGDGWVLMYMHMAANGRVNVGDKVKTRDRIGHPSCEGGYSTADHLHFARLYNGQWIAAGDARRPLLVSGWKLQGADSEYDGSMTRGSSYLEAYNGHSASLNMITSDDGPAPSTAGNDNSQGNASGGDNSVAAAPASGGKDGGGHNGVAPASIGNTSGQSAGATATPAR